MPRELVVIQVGQCGNQIGGKFWEVALKEHALAAKGIVYDEPLSSFFRNVDTRYEPPRNIDVGDGKGPIRTLKARVRISFVFVSSSFLFKKKAILIDTETGVLNALLRSDLGELFDSHHFIKDDYGAGNNWATGHLEYGPKHEEAIINQIRKTAEMSDALQSFFLLHSLGGGTVAIPIQREKKPIFFVAGFGAGNIRAATSCGPISRTIRFLGVDMLTENSGGVPFHLQRFPLG